MWSISRTYQKNSWYVQHRQYIFDHSVNLNGIVDGIVTPLFINEKVCPSSTKKHQTTILKPDNCMLPTNNMSTSSLGTLIACQHIYLSRTTEQFSIYTTEAQWMVVSNRHIFQGIMYTTRRWTNMWTGVLMLNIHVLPTDNYQQQHSCM